MPALHPWRLTHPSLHSGQGVVKLDVQPKCLAVGPGGYTVVVCIGQVRLPPGSDQKVQTHCAVSGPHVPPQPFSPSLLRALLRVLRASHVFTESSAAPSVRQASSPPHGWGH